jgi:hypothetical protein
MSKKYESVNDLFVAVAKALRERGAPPGVRVAGEEMGKGMGFSAPKGTGAQVYVPGYLVTQRLEEQFPRAGGDPGKVDDAELEGFVAGCVENIVERYSRDWLKMADSSGLDRAPENS